MAGRSKEILTTGEVAKICNVAPRTVSKWFDSGQLRGYRIPGSRDRRIPLNSLVRFMKAHHIPLDGLQSGTTTVVIVDDEPEIVDALQRVLLEQTPHQVSTASSGFEAGIVCERARPDVILLDMHLGDVNGEQVLKLIRDNDDLQLAKVIAMSGKLTDGQAHALLGRGFDGYLKKPFNVRQVLDAIDAALNQGY